MTWRFLTVAVLLFVFAIVGRAEHDDFGGDAANAADKQSETVTSGGYSVPRARNAVFFEAFDEEWSTRWVPSKHAKYTGEWEVASGAGEPLAGDRGLIVREKAKHHAIFAGLARPFDPSRGLVLQYEVRAPERVSCGGLYLKLIEADAQLTAADFSNESPYVVMFGPDKCGNNNKVHFIIRHKNPKTGVITEKHLKSPPNMVDDTNTHLYTLIIRTDNTYEILIDQESSRKGSLFEDLDPAINPPAEIDDPEDTQPSDWVTEKKIVDPDDKKPDDWDESAPARIVDPDDTKPTDWLDDEPLEIPDPDAVKPADWSDEDDGEWEAPLVDNPKCASGKCGKWKARQIPNPEYKGKWKPRMIDNPAYKGPYVPRRIPNPDYAYDATPYRLREIGGIGIELWHMDQDMQFDNIYLGHDEQDAYAVAESSWRAKFEAEAAKYSDEADDGRPDNSAAGRFLRLWEKYPIVIVLAGLVLVVLLLWLFSMCLVKSPQSHGHSHADGHSHGADASPGDADDDDDADDNGDNPATSSARDGNAGSSPKVAASPRSASDSKTEEAEIDSSAPTKSPTAARRRRAPKEE